MFEVPEKIVAVRYTNAKIDEKGIIDPNVISASADLLYYHGDVRQVISCGLKEKKRCFKISKSTLESPFGWSVADISGEEVRWWYYKTGNDVSREEERWYVYENSGYVHWKSHLSLEPNILADRLSSQSNDYPMSNVKMKRLRESDILKYGLPYNFEPFIDSVAKNENPIYSTEEDKSTPEANTQYMETKSSTQPDDGDNEALTSPIVGGVKLRPRPNIDTLPDSDWLSLVASANDHSKDEDELRNEAKNENPHSNLNCEGYASKDEINNSSSSCLKDYSGIHEADSTVNADSITEEKTPNQTTQLSPDEDRNPSMSSKEHRNERSANFTLTSNKHENSFLSSSNEHLDEGSTDTRETECNSFNIFKSSLYKKASVESGFPMEFFQLDFEDVALVRMQAGSHLSYLRNPFSVVDISNAASSDCLIGVWDFFDKDQIKRLVPHGKGKLMTPEGKLIYIGEFVNGKRCGFGSGLIADLSKDLHLEIGYYQGHWKSNCRHGTGRLHYLFGRHYNGQWFLDEVHGSGIMTLADGSAMRGYFAAGLPDGEFIYCSSEGFIEQREYFNGNLVRSQCVQDTNYDESYERFQNYYKPSRNSNYLEVEKLEKLPRMKQKLSSSSLDFIPETDSFLRVFRNETGLFIKRQLSGVKIACEEMLLNAKDEMVKNVKAIKSVKIDVKTDYLTKKLEALDSKIDSVATKFDGIIDICRSVLDKQEATDNSLSRLSVNIASFDSKDSVVVEETLKHLKDENCNLKLQLEKTEQFYKCEICHESTKDCIILPCMHMESCSKCIRRIKRTDGLPKCPICRGSIQGEVIRKLDNCTL